MMPWHATCFSVFLHPTRLMVDDRLSSPTMHIVLPSAYFPPISYFAYLLHGRVDRVTIEAKEHFVKQSIRSRCVVADPHGRLTLHVPKEKTGNRSVMDEVRTVEEAYWRRTHWRSIADSYRSSPYFEYYEDDFEPFFNEEEDRIFQIGQRSVAKVCELLRVPHEVHLTTEYWEGTDALDLRNTWNNKPYREHPPVAHFPEYIQVFRDRNGFLPDLSILDLLFCLGPKSLDYLRELKLKGLE